LTRRRSSNKINQQIESSHYHSKNMILKLHKKDKKRLYSIANQVVPCRK
jgi:hypothetical protein